MCLIVSINRCVSPVFLLLQKHCHLYPPLIAALNVIMSIAEEFEEFLSEVSDVCSHISIREDDNGPFVFSLGLKEFHTLQMRHLDGSYQLELWRGNSDDETIISSPSFERVSDAFLCAKEWLLHDNI